MKDIQEVLAVANRPRDFSRLIGQDKLIKSIRQRVKSKRMPKAWLFAGPSGGGKTTIARIVALALQEGRFDDTFGEVDASTYSSFSVYDIIEVNAALHNKVEDIEKLVERSRYRPNNGSRFKVIIFDEAHRITTQAQQLLLKPTEDAISDTVWMFCTTEPGKINLTLKRRCAEYRVEPLKKEGIRQLLKLVGGPLDIPNLAKFFNAALRTDVITTPGFVLKALEKFIADGDADNAFSPDGLAGDVFAAVQAMVKGNWDGVKKEIGDGKFDSDTARKLRAIAGGYLRSMLMKADGGNRALAIANAIEDFAKTAGTYDESMLTFHIIAATYKATHRFKSA